jgi:hypothetical protein
MQLAAFGEVAAEGAATVEHEHGIGRMGRHGGWPCCNDNQAGAARPSGAGLSG